eukprot:m.166389 g.166389  ORF g.166389 m.166389 type:complete len:490 (+) comp15241_c0_seq1:1595-3064(+)
MGGRHTVERIVQQPDPATLKLLEQVTEQNKMMAERFERAMQEMANLEQQRVAAEKMREEYNKKVEEIEQREKDPKRIIEAQNKLFDNLCDQVRVRFANNNAGAAVSFNNCVNVAVIGRVSSGKSTLINAVVGEKIAKTGIGRTTVDVRLIARLGLFSRDATVVNEIIVSTEPGAADAAPPGATAANTRQPRPTINIFDIPGDDEKFNYLSLDGALAVLSTMHIIVVLFSDSMDSILRYVRLAKAMGKVVVVVRTQIDNRSDDDDRTWQEELEQDRADLAAKIGAGTLTRDELMVYGVSGRNMLKAVAKPDEYVDLYQWHELNMRLRRAALDLYTNFAIDSRPRLSVVLVHAREDQPAAAAVATGLVNQGLTVFEVEKAAGRGNAGAAITGGVEHASIVVACVSRALLAKVTGGAPTNDECVAVFRHCSETNKRMLPFVIDSGVPTPLPAEVARAFGTTAPIAGGSGVGNLNIKALVTALGSAGLGASPL